MTRAARTHKPRAVDNENAPPTFSHPRTLPTQKMAYKRFPVIDKGILPCNAVHLQHYDRTIRILASAAMRREFRLILRVRKLGSSIVVLGHSCALCLIRTPQQQQLRFVSLMYGELRPRPSSIDLQVQVRTVGRQVETAKLPAGNFRK